jgi:hypothetical protein
MSDSWMGSLAAQDRYRELGNDPWTNTMRGTPAAPGQGFAAAEPVLYHTASPLVDITEGDIAGATSAAMGVSGGGLKTSVEPGSILSGPQLKAQAKAEALHGKYPQYAESYPPTGPADLMAKMPDPAKPGKFLSKAFKEPVPYASWEEALAKDTEPGFFLQKKLTPEAEQFAKDRNIIQRNMDLHGYDPYFDPAKRFDVDASKYGPFEDTAIKGQPKSAKSQAEWEGKYGTEEIRARLRAGFEEGKKIPESDRWYYMGQLEKEYIKEYGEKAGRKAFEREFADSMAATTGGANPYDNFLMAHYANYLNKQGQSAAQRAYEMPTPIGGRFASGNMEQAQKYFEQGKGHWPEDNSKRYDFSSAFTGNKAAGTIDEQMMGAFDPTLKDLQPKWYGPATGTMRQEAYKYGTDPRGFQDITWAGLKKLKTEEGAKGSPFSYEGPMINHINRSIETTHRLTGMPREEVVRRGLIRKEIPMYGIPGAVGMGALAVQDGYQREGM